ncbi:PPK2 family polyphosphate kinase [Thiofilum flexile]|uniref:PPK2 family polyphosphate kinase n=1 Tax=Thiofilum flexile TaxID=125627 RepID=UPI00037011BF|nr:PPK2 family polyphosphate kinase [Thiofilum flexile]
MHEFPQQHRVPFKNFKLSDYSTQPPANTPSKEELKKRLADLTEELATLQEKLYADNRYGLLLVFQAMDAAGKDGTIAAVTTGVNPAGFQISSFKQPSTIELEHDFLWRTELQLPERGRIGIFNRSYYEEVLVVKVHPEYLAGQQLPETPKTEEALQTFWQERYESIRDHEKHLARNGFVVLKFFLNVSKAEQKKRFLDRLNDKEKQWKFSLGDLAERKYWDHYMQAYEDALDETSHEYAPWYAIPADNKHYMRVAVAEIITETLKALPLAYPSVSDKDKALFEQARQDLAQEQD